LSGASRNFGALVAHDGVTIVEYRAERTGLRVVGSWTDAGRSTSIDEALARLNGLLTLHSPKRATVAVALEQFGVVHHTMTLPSANDAVLRPVIAREIQRAFGVTDPVVAFTRGSTDERRAPDRANAATAPHQLMIAAAPRDTIRALQAGLVTADIEIATVVPKAMHALYEAAGASAEPTAVLACVESGPHVAFFIEGRLELAIDPPIALEGDRPTTEMILDQFERGAVYFRQQFRGASASRVLLAARADEYATLTEQLQSRFGAHVTPLFHGAASPEAMLAMGAVLEARRDTPLDLFPHAPSSADRIAGLMRGPNGVVAGFAAAAVLAAIWAGSQALGLSSLRRERETLRASVAAALPAIETQRHVAEHRADLVKQIEFVNASSDERATLATALSGIASNAPEAIRFDSLGVTRGANGWTLHIAGKSTAGSAAQVMRALDAFVQSVRAVPSVSSSSLDTFDYRAADSTHAHAVAADFRVTAELARSGAHR
jgi:hypothetical protein